jgi:hypothetical protein
VFVGDIRQRQYAVGVQASLTYALSLAKALCWITDTQLDGSAEAMFPRAAGSHQRIFQDPL